jgi:ATP-dependent DNA helicase RecG
MIGSVSGTTLEMDVKLAEIAKKAQKRSKRSNLEDVIYEMCHIKALEREEIARLTKRSNIYMRLVLKGMISNGRLRYKYPEMIKHPHQAYMAISEEPER